MYAGGNMKLKILEVHARCLTIATEHNKLAALPSTEQISPNNFVENRRWSSGAERRVRRLALRQISVACWSTWA